MITITSKGNFSKANSFMEKLKEIVKRGDLDEYGDEGVAALRQSTPKRTGLTSESWKYTIERDGDTATIVWENTNIQNGVNIATLIQYGHGTRSGTYVEGHDYINPPIERLSKEIVNETWKEVKQL